MAEEEPGIAPEQLRAMRARTTIEDELQEARRQVFGARSRIRSRPWPVVVADRSEGGEIGEIGDMLRALVTDVEAETQRLQEEAALVRSEAERAGTTLQEELERAAQAIVERSTEDLDREVGPTVAQAVEALTTQVAHLDRVTGTLVSAVDRLVQLAEQPPPEPISGALADVLGELTDQLRAVSGAIGDQVRDAVEQALIADARRRDASMTQALARLTDEVVRLRRRLPVARKPGAKKASPPIDAG